MFTLCMTLIIGLLGVVMDIGWGYYRKQVEQASVDAAVLAGATQAASLSSSSSISCGSDGIICQDPTPCTASSNNSVIRTACQYGIVNGVAPSSLYISAGTTDSGTGAAVSYWIKATVSESAIQGFSKVLNVAPLSISASATAGVMIQNGTGGGCVYALDPNSASALEVGASSLTTSCGVYVDSTNSGAINVNGSSSYIDATGAAVNVVGNWTCGGCLYVKPTPTTGVPVADDPLTALAPPSFSGCDQVNWTQSSANATATLNPGVYCGGIKISGGTVTLNSGSYILNGGGLSIQGNNTTVQGNGVFFYNTSNGYTYGNLSISGAPAVTLTAPTSGVYQGILYFRDRTVCPSTNDAITGNTNTVLSGSVYVHCSNTGGGYSPGSLMFSGQSTPGHYVGLVADIVKITGNSHLLLDPTGGGYTGIKTASRLPYLVQ